MGSPSDSTRPRFSIKLMLAMTTAVGIGCVPIAIDWRLWPETLLLTFTLLVVTPLLFQSNPLLFYCRYLNPLVALLVFFLCFHAGTWDDSGRYHSLLQSEPLSRYFIAKGVFAGIAVFLLGKVLETMVAARNSSDD